MIEYMAIKNLAIIEELSVCLEAGLNAFTGETGAGKSLLVDAIAFLIGARSSTDLIGNYGDELKVEASLNLEKSNWQDRLSPLGIEEPTLYLSRTLNRQGRSKARINGRAVPISLLKETLSPFVHLHGQQELEALSSSTYQLNYLDSFAGPSAWELRRKAEDLLMQVRQLKEGLSNLEEEGRQSEKERDLLLYEIGEIESAKLKIDEDQALLEERDFLHSQLEIKEKISSFCHLMKGDSSRAGLHDLLTASLQGLSSIKGKKRDLDLLIERLEDLTIELEDLSGEFSHILDSLNDNQERLIQVEERLDTIARLKRRYGKSLAEVLDYLKDARHRLELLEDKDRQISSLKEELEDRRLELYKLLSSLREIREKSAFLLAEKIISGLKELGIDQPTFEVEIDPLPEEELRATGLDWVEFLFSANPSEEPKPLGKVASGGELSRLMLILKSILANADQATTLIFDEIDSGIGGRVGEAVALKLKEISRSRQVLCITHLAQIASRADAHFLILKDPGGGRLVNLKKLSPEERVGEIARMLSGTRITSAVLAHAQELLKGDEGDCSEFSS